MKKILSPQELTDFLNEKANQYNTPDFVQDDPISIPHQFTDKKDIEIAGFLSATIAWGQRKTIVKNAHKLMEIMGNSPYDFVMSFTPKNAEKLQDFKHRTFNQADLAYFLKALKHLYQNYEDLEAVFSEKITPKTQFCHEAIDHFRTLFFEQALPENQRTKKHVSSPKKGSAAKRINMFLRWMVRQDNRGVDLGIWHSIKPAQLTCPLDVHSGNVARKLGLLTRTQNDLKATIELDTVLRKLDANDPVKYDFALFGLGVYERF